MVFLLPVWKNADDTRAPKGYLAVQDLTRQAIRGRAAVGGQRKLVKTKNTVLEPLERPLGALFACCNGIHLDA